MAVVRGRRPVAYSVMAVVRGRRPVAYSVMAVVGGRLWTAPPNTRRGDPSCEAGASGADSGAVAESQCLRIGPWDSQL